MKACVVLHNYLQSSEKELPPGKTKYCPIGLTEPGTSDGEGVTRSNLQSIRSTVSPNAKNIDKARRDIQSNYFLSNARMVPWQEDYVLSGAVSLSFPPQY